MPRRIRRKRPTVPNIGNTFAPTPHPGRPTTPSPIDCEHMAQRLVRRSLADWRILDPHAARLARLKSREES